jgi:protein TonB
VYPRAALLNEIAGWVDLHFTVDLQGMTRDIDVIDAQPEGRFEDAAINALSGYEFEPFEFEGERYERRLRVRISFQLD